MDSILLGGDSGAVDAMLVLDISLVDRLGKVVWALLTFVKVVFEPPEDVFIVPLNMVVSFSVVLICELNVASFSVAEVICVVGLVSTDILFIALVDFVVSLLCLIVSIVFVAGGFEVGLFASFIVVSAIILGSVFGKVLAGEDEPVSESIEVAGQ